MLMDLHSPFARTRGTIPSYICAVSVATVGIALWKGKPVSLAAVEVQSLVLNDYPEQFESSFPMLISFVSLFWILGQPFLLFKCPYEAVKEAMVTTMVSIWFCVTVT